MINASNPVIGTKRFSIPLKHEDLDAATCLTRVFDQEEILEQQLAATLIGEEIVVFNGFRVSHAKADFLAGRLAAKSALQILLPDTAILDWQMIRGAWHQPCIRGPINNHLVTIAHSAGVGVAVAFDDRWHCGIDIESLSRCDEETIATQVSPEEARWAKGEGSNNQSRWMMLWTAREALGKALRTGLLLPDALSPTSDWTETETGFSANFQRNDLLSVRSVVASGFVVSQVFPRNATADRAIESTMQWLHDSLEKLG